MPSSEWVQLQNRQQTNPPDSNREPNTVRNHHNNYDRSHRHHYHHQEVEQQLMTPSGATRSRTLVQLVAQGGLRRGRELSSDAVESGASILKRGAVVESDHESWAVQTPDLRVHLILPKKGGESEGW